MVPRKIDTSFNPLSALSPLDGRYRKAVQDLALFFSEEALMKYRLKVEVEYLIALSQEKKLKDIRVFSSAQQRKLRSVYQQFDRNAADRIKDIEATTNHDVKAIEYYLREALTEQKLDHLHPWIHFALTSEDVNNLAYALMWQDAIQFIYLPEIKKLQKELRKVSRTFAEIPLLALTHGQPATTSTVGKEYAVFVQRISRQKAGLEGHRLLGKFSGATGTWSAHVLSFPNVNWEKLSQNFVEDIGLDFNPITTQIESHDALAESFYCIKRINSILLDLCRDTWLYISRGVLGQKSIDGEVGSSTMPHKINPIQFENAEGNLGLSNAILGHLAEKLQTSRMQRDLSDSTAIRNQGVGLAYSYLALKNIMEGMSRVTVNESKIKSELDQHWEVLGEAIQTILRKEQQSNAYEQLKTLMRGRSITKRKIQNFIRKMDINEKDKQKLMELTPAGYSGLAAKLAKKN